MPWDPAGLVPYLTADQAMSRLASKFDLTDAPLNQGDVEAASDELDAMRPFVGWRRDYKQWRQFPRSLDPDGSIAGPEVPEAVLDAVALIAYAYSLGHEPERRVRQRIKPYQRRTGHVGPGAPFVGADPLNQRQ